jgi:uncharacterized protein YoxC
MADDEFKTETRAAISALTTSLTALSDNVTALTTKVDKLVESVAGMQQQITGIQQQVTEVKEQVTGVQQQVAGVQQQVTEVKEQVGGMQQQMTGMQQQMEKQAAAQANADTRMLNSMKALAQPLAKLKYTASGDNWPATVEQPPSLLELAVSGAENVPGTARRSGWSKEKSRAFLKVVLPGGYESESDNEGENGDKARTMRMRVIESVGARFERVVASVHHL